MKNIFSYYIAILLPILIVIIFFEKMTSNIFVLILTLYFIYRNFIDGYRLFLLGKIKKNEIYKTFILFYNIKYFKTLYFKV